MLTMCMFHGVGLFSKVKTNLQIFKATASNLSQDLRN